MRKFFGYLSEVFIFGTVSFILIVGPLNFGSRALTGQGWIEIAAACLLFFWMIRLICLAEPVFVWTKITLPLLVFLGYVLLRYIFCDVKWQARQEFLILTSYTVVFLTVVNNLQRRWQLHALFWLILGIAGAEAVDGIWRYYRGGLDDCCRFFFFDCALRFGFQNLTRAGGTFWTPDHYAAYLIIAFVLVASHLVVWKRSWTERILLVYLGGFILIAIALSKSRGGWIGLLCAVVALVLLVMRGRFLEFRSALVGMIVLAGVAYFLWTKHGLVAERMEELAQHGEPTRSKMYWTALQMARDHPWFGVGPQMYDLHFWRYAFNANGPQFVHCEYLQVLADLGIVGAALAAWLLVVFYRSALQMAAPKDADASSYVSSEVAKRLAAVIGGTAAVFAMTVHSLFDFVFHVMGVGVTCAVIVALMYASAALRRKRSETDWDSFGFDRAYRMLPLGPIAQRGVLIALGGSFLVFMFLSLNNYFSAVSTEDGYGAAHSKEPDRQVAIDDFERALDFDPNNFTAALWLGTAHWEETAGNWEFLYPEAEQALDWHARAIQSNPYFGDAYLNRANLYMYMLQPEKAQKDCEQMIRISPYNPVYRLLYGKICFMLADYKGAREQFEKASQLGVEAGDPVADEAKRDMELVRDAPRRGEP